MNTNFLAPSSRRYRALLGLGGIAATIALVAGGSFAANAADDSDTTEANVEVETSISLTALTETFTLTGAPTDVVSNAGAVTFNVLTNNNAGYAVTVQSTTPTLVPATAGNTDSIPITALSVTGDSTLPLSATAAVTVHSQATRSDEAGDDLTNGYGLTIPFVNSDTYTATLTYIAATL